jgi:hypothetical protein
LTVLTNSPTCNMYSINNLLHSTPNSQPSEARSDSYPLKMIQVPGLNGGFWHLPITLPEVPVRDHWKSGLYTPLVHNVSNLMVSYYGISINSKNRGSKGAVSASGSSGFEYPNSLLSGRTGTGSDWQCVQPELCYFRDRLTWHSHRWQWCRQIPALEVILSCQSTKFFLNKEKRFCRAFFNN